MSSTRRECRKEVERSWKRELKEGKGRKLRRKTNHRILNFASFHAQITSQNCNGFATNIIRVARTKSLTLVDSINSHPHRSHSLAVSSFDLLDLLLLLLPVLDLVHSIQYLLSDRVSKNSLLLLLLDSHSSLGGRNRSQVLVSFPSVAAAAVADALVASNSSLFDSDSDLDSGSVLVLVLDLFLSNSRSLLLLLS